MQKIFTFRVSLMNGTVTANTHVEACASRELAEQVKEAIVKANEHNDTLHGMRLHFSDVEEVTVWEDADEVPVLNEQPEKPKTREQLEQERDECLNALMNARAGVPRTRRDDPRREWLRETAERHEQRLKEIARELDGMDGSQAPPPAEADKSIVLEYPVPIEQEEVDFLKAIVRKHRDGLQARTLFAEWMSHYVSRYGASMYGCNVYIVPLDDGRTRVSFLAPAWDTKREDGV